MLTNFNEICMSVTPGHDKKNSNFVFGEFYLIFRVTAETLLAGFSCLIYDAAPLRLIVPSNYYFTAVIIDHFQMKN